MYDPNAGTFLDPGTYQRLNGVCYVATGCVPEGIIDNRAPFAMPRVNVAWDIDGEGNNVIRGGYGMFYNRNMGNVEYDNTLRLPPTAYRTGVTPGDGGSDFAGGVGLTYDTMRFANGFQRAGAGALSINTLDLATTAGRRRTASRCPTRAAFPGNRSSRRPTSARADGPGQPQQRQRDPLGGMTGTSATPT